MSKLPRVATHEVDQFCDVATGVRLCYRVHGPDEGIPLLLVVGLSLQLTYWPNGLIEQLVRSGFRVIVFDNRDVGRSSCMAQQPPGLVRQALKRPAASAYSLEDMALDAVGLLDHLGVAAAHVAGMSMGGMIAQILASRHARRVLSLTSMFSTTGSTRVGQPAISTLLMLTKAPPSDRSQSVTNFVRLSKHIGSNRYAIPDDILAAYAANAWDRGHGPKAHEGVARQIGAIMKSGDRTKELRDITAPTLIVHGEQDRMVAHSGGVATAKAIPKADFITVHGMGHAIGEDVAPVLSDLISGHIRRNGGLEPGQARPQENTP